MKKKIIAAIALGGAALFAIPAGVAYAVSSDDNGGSVVIGGASHGAQGGASHSTHSQNATADVSSLVEPGATIAPDDAANLTFMVEEEKLAHDLYVELGDAWDLKVFTNISAAETQHEDSVKALLDAYGLEDPTVGLAIGEFTDPALQDLYDTLLARGLESTTAALEVGAIVEETDIADLRDRASDSAAIDQVFSNLESGSENHLRAFVKNLDRLGVTYDAQVLSSSDVAAIIGQ